MSLMFSFKSWKLNNSVLTSFCAISRIWSWYSINWLVDNWVFFWCTYILGTRKLNALATCGVLVSSPFANKVRSSSVLRGRKYYDMIIRAPLALVIGFEPNANPSVWITCLVAETLGATLAFCAAKYERKKNGKFWCDTTIVCIGRDILPNHGIMWEAIEWPRRSFPWSWTLYKFGMTN